MFISFSLVCCSSVGGSGPFPCHSAAVSALKTLFFLKFLSYLLSSSSALKRAHLRWCRTGLIEWNGAGRALWKVHRDAVWADARGHKVSACWDTWTHLNGTQGAINGIIILALSASHLAGRLGGGRGYVELSSAAALICSSACAAAGQGSEPLEVIM